MATTYRRFEPRGVALVRCGRCAVGVSIETASQTGGYCRGCAPALPGMELHVSKQIDAAAEMHGEQLTAAMREPGRDISRKAGDIERHSPLFYGTGENPSLF